MGAGDRPVNGWVPPPNFIDRAIPAGPELDSILGISPPGRVGMMLSEAYEFLTSRPIAGVDNGLSTKKRGPGRGHRRSAEATAG